MGGAQLKPIAEFEVLSSADHGSGCAASHFRMAVDDRIAIRKFIIEMDFRYEKSPLPSSCRQGPPPVPGRIAATENWIGKAR
jgi:hypothetical protein